MATQHGHETGEELSSNLIEGISSQGVFQSILHEALRACQAERGFLLFDANDVAAALNADRGDYDREIVKAVRQTKRVLIRESVSGDRRVARHEERTPRVRRSVLAAPLVNNNVIEGILYLDRALERGFGEEDASLLETLASQAGHAFKLAATKYAEDKQRTEEEYAGVLSGQDKLTGLAHARVLQESLKALFHDPLQLPSSLILLGIDDYAYYRSRNGDPSGNELLKRLGLLLSSSLRAPDLAARINSDTLAILLVKTSLDDARAVAERLRLSISKTAFPFASFQPLGHLSISLGVASAPQQAKNPEAFLAAAQGALRQASQTKNSVVLCELPSN